MMVTCGAAPLPAVLALWSGASGLLESGVWGLGEVLEVVGDPGVGSEPLEGDVDAMRTRGDARCYTGRCMLVQVAL